MATSGLKINGKTKILQLLGSIGLTDTEVAEINAELDELISETSETWLESLSGYSIVQKVRFLQFFTKAILDAISDQGVEVPETQPYRTIHGLIDQIKVGNLEAAEIEAELENLLSETDETTLESLDGMTIAEKIVFAQTCKSSILEAIANKGVTVPDVQPLSTVGNLIGKIESGGGGISATANASCINIMSVFAVPTQVDATTVAVNLGNS